MPVRPIRPSKAAEREHLAALRELLTEARSYTDREVMPMADALTREMRAKGLFPDFDAVFSAFKAVMRSLQWSVARMVDRIHNAEAERHTQKWAAAVKAAVGIDIGALIARADLDDLMAMRAIDNAALITSLSDDIVGRIEREVLDAIREGRTARDLQARLSDQFGVVDRRAKVIARDQIGSLTADLNQARQTQAGIATYTWRTSEDERVRSLHVQLNGRRFKWDEPGPDAGQHPGKPIQCRCTAEALIEIED